MLITTRYPVTQTVLNPFIKFFWHLETDEAVHLYHKLLPSLETDLILNFSSPICYSSPQFTTTTTAFHLNTHKDSYHYIQQNGRLSVLGVAFYPHGLYPFFQKPLGLLTDDIISAVDVLGPLVARLEYTYNEIKSPSILIQELENALVEQLNPSYIESDTLRILYAFYRENPHTTLLEFCQNHGISLRSLERLFMTHIGISPKAFQQIHRFQKLSNFLLYNKINLNLTELSYDYHYYDQTHFIKDFKHFSGTTPSQFLKDSRTIKEVSQLHL